MFDTIIKCVSLDKSKELLLDKQTGTTLCGYGKISIIQELRQMNESPEFT